MTSIIDKAVEFIQKKEMLNNGDRLLCAVSGGKDSIALLHLLDNLKERLQFDLFCFHMDHCTRNGASHNDAMFVASVCEQLNVPLHISVEMIHEGSRFEERAREARYRAMELAASRFSCTRIATAHTFDDNVETSLMRIFSGTSIHGASAIPPVRGIIIRPLLEVRTAEILEYIAAHKLKYVTDISNADPAYKRNLMRHTILPFLRSYYPDVDNALFMLSVNSAEAEALIERKLQLPEINKIDNGFFFDADRLPAERSEFIFFVASLIRNSTKNYVSSGMLNEIYKNYINRAKTHYVLYSSPSLIVEHTRVNSREVIRITKPSLDRDDPHPSEICHIFRGGELTFSFGIYTFCINEITEGGEVRVRDSACGSGEHLCLLRIDEASPPSVIRQKKEGDVILCRNIHRSLKKVFINEKLSMSEKKSALVIEYRGEVAAIIMHHLGRRDYIGDAFLASPGCEKKVLAIHCVPNMSDRL